MHEASSSRDQAMALSRFGTGPRASSPRTLESNAEQPPPVMCTASRHSIVSPARAQVRAHSASRCAGGGPPRRGRLAICGDRDLTVRPPSRRCVAASATTALHNHNHNHSARARASRSLHAPLGHARVFPPGAGVMASSRRGIWPMGASKHWRDTQGQCFASPRADHTSSPLGRTPA